MNNKLAQTIDPGEASGERPKASEVLCGEGEGTGVKTAIGCVPIQNTNALASGAATVGIGISGGIAILIIAYAAFGMMTSQGDPKKFQASNDLLFSAIAGLIMIILSGFIFRLLGIQVLGLF